MTDTNLHYKEDTYKAYGNNGNCYNNNINDINCGGVFNQLVRDDLYNMSDHLPVVMELETDQEIIFLDRADQTVVQPFSLKSTLVSNVLTLFTPQVNIQHRLFSIYNTLGQEILSFDTATNTTVVGVSQIANGIYYITNHYTKQTLKFVKTF